MNINLPKDLDFDLTAVSQNINSAVGRSVPISVVGRTVYIHEQNITKEDQATIENLVLGSPVGVQVKVKRGRKNVDQK